VNNHPLDIHGHKGRHLAVLSLGREQADMRSYLHRCSGDEVGDYRRRD